MVFQKILIWFASITFLTLFCNFHTAFGQNDHFYLKDLKYEIVAAITNARELSDKEPYFLVKKVNLELQGTTITEGAVKIGFAIPVFNASVDLGVGGEYSSQDKLEIEMKPADTIVVGGEKKINLAGIIKDLKETFKRKKGESPSFILPSVKYEKTWALQRDAEGGINVVIAKGDVSISKEKRQKITFILCETKNFVDCVKD